MSGHQHLAFFSVHKKKKLTPVFRSKLSIYATPIVTSVARLANDLEYVKVEGLLITAPEDKQGKDMDQSKKKRSQRGLDMNKAPETEGC